MKQNYEENLKLVHEGIACTNTKPISTFSGGAPLAQIGGLTVAQFVEDPVAGAYARKCE